MAVPLLCLIAGWRGRRVAPPLAAALLVLAGGVAGRRAGATARAACTTRIEEGAAILAAGVVLDRIPAAASRADPPVASRLGSATLVAGGHACAPGLLRFTAVRGATSHEVGARLLIRGRWRAFGAPGGPRPADLYGYVRARDVDRVSSAAGSAPPTARLRGRFARRLDRRLAGDEAAIARALVLADRSTLSYETRRRFVDAGIVHLLAISGLHVGLLAGGLAWLVGLRDRGPRRWIVAATLVSGYVVLIGAPPAAVRATLLFWGHAITRWRGRPARLADLAGLAALAALAAGPLTLVDPGFQLSFAGFAGIVAGHRLGRRLGGPRRLRGALVPVAASVGAFAATAPLAAVHFGRVVATSIPASLVSTGLVGLALPAVFLTAVVPGPAGDAVAPAASLLLRALAGLADAFAGLPFGWRVGGPAGWTWVAVGTLATAASGARRAHRWRYGLAAALAVSATLWRPTLQAASGRGHPLLCTLDVGQGDAAVVRTGAGRWLVFDGGPGTSILGGRRLSGGPPLDPRTGDAGRRVLVPFLRARAAGRIELFALSHPHLDHFGGAGALFDAFEVARVLDPGLVEPSVAYRAFLDRVAEEGATWIPARAGGRLRIDDVTIEVLWPPGAGLDANEGSFGFRLDAGGFRYVNTGDAPADVERAILARVAPGGLAAEILKLGHHGSRTSSAVAWLRAVDPELAVVSAGRGNRYGHPHGVTLARLDSAGVRRVWRTDRDGPLCVEGEADGWRIVRP